MKRRANSWILRGCIIMLLLFMGDWVTVWGGNVNIITGTLTESTETTGGEEAPVSSEIALNKKSLTMAPATTSTLKLKGAKASKVKWKSTKKSVATVDNSGKVTAKAKGTAEIRAVYNGVTYKCKVKVKYESHTVKDGMIYKDANGSFGRTGRWFKKNIAGGKYYFTNVGGSAVYFKVAGSKYVNVNFVTKTMHTTYFAYSVDGGSMKRQAVTNGKISVGNTKTHYVRLVIDALSWENLWGEAGVGIKSIKPVTSDGVVTAISPQNPVIAFYGDSITEGGRVLGMALSASSTSATHSYAWYCAEQLDCVPYFIGFGGTGILTPGDCATSYNIITSFSSGRKAEKFDADVIVMAYGTNDANVDNFAFTSEYKRVVNKLHKDHKDAYIMSVIPLNQRHAQDVRNAVKGIKYCTLVETSNWKISYTDGLHPNIKGAKTMGKNLAKKIASKRKVELK